MRLLLNLLMTLGLMIILAPASFAQDAAAQATSDATAETNRNNKSHVIQPENCEFRMTFPGEPYTARRCDPDNPDVCNKILSYTKVYDLDATVMYNVTCNAAEEGMYERYSLDVMKTTLEAMVGKGVLTDFESDAQEREHYKHAILVGTGKSGDQDRMYSAQLWIGKSSVFTIEGEIVGFAGPEADAMFADVMSSVEYVSSDAKNLDKSEDKAEEDTAETDKKDKVAE